MVDCRTCGKLSTACYNCNQLGEYPRNWKKFLKAFSGKHSLKVKPKHELAIDLSLGLQMGHIPKRSCEALVQKMSIKKGFELLNLLFLTFFPSLCGF